MKGSLRTVRGNNHLSKTNFNDWSDTKLKLPKSSRTATQESESSKLLEPCPSEKFSKSMQSQFTIETDAIQKIIRKGHPLMSKKEIRNYRLPFYEALLQNLKEDGFLLTHEFITDLIDLDDAYHKDLEPHVGLKNRPVLKLTKSMLTPLANGLTKAETARLNNEKTKEATIFLELAKSFIRAKDPSWNWITHEMFEQCMEVLKSTENPIDPKLQATAQYLFGCFLFNDLNMLNEAKTQTENSMSLSEGKNWTVSDSKDVKGKPLYLESCSLLHKIYLEMADRELSNKNTEEAIQLCRNSLLWSKVMTDKAAEADALGKLINIYLKTHQLYSVPELIQSYMKLCTELENNAGICEGYILRAKYHDSVGENVNVIQDMRELLQVAKENKITKMVAIAHHKLATHGMLKGAHKEFLQHSVEAYMSYLDLRSNLKDIEEAKCLVGIAQAQEIMNQYCTLVFEADNNNLTEQRVLSKWKTLAIPFFSQSFVLFPEMSTNVALLSKVESKKVEEMLGKAERRHSEFASSTRKQSRISRQPSSAFFLHMPPQLSYQPRETISLSRSTSKDRTTSVFQFRDMRT